MRPALIVLLLVSACDRNAELLPSPDAGAFGAPCSPSCASGLTCYMQLPEGFCSKTCGSSSDCPSGAVCGSVDEITVCLPVCNPSAGASCRDGYSCCPDH